MMGIFIFCVQSMENTDMQTHKTPHKPIKETQHVCNVTLKPVNEHTLANNLITYMSE